MKIIHFDEIDSTNKYVKTNYESLEDLTIVSTDFQTSGKGRNDRKWFALPNQNIMFSILIKDKDLISNFSDLSLLSCLIIREFLEFSGVTGAEVKWPNDVYVNGKKICGILLEGNIPNYIVIGIGLNTNQVEFNDEYRTTPTSVALELGEKVDLKAFREDLFTFILNYIDEYKSTFVDVIDDFNTYNYLKDRKVSIDGVTCIAKDVVSSGKLQIETESGIIEVGSGEIDLL